MDYFAVSLYQEVIKRILNLKFEKLQVIHVPEDRLFFMKNKKWAHKKESKGIAPMRQITK